MSENFHLIDIQKKNNIYIKVYTIYHIKYKNIFISKFSLMICSEYSRAVINY